MTMIRAFGLGLVLAIVTIVVVTMAGFFGGLTISLPGLVELDSSTEGMNRAELELNPLAPLLLAVVLAAVVWLIGRIAGRRA